eukprot:c175_g1_i1 orf=424-1605(+)
MPMSSVNGDGDQVNCQIDDGTVDKHQIHPVEAETEACSFEWRKIKEGLHSSVRNFNNEVPDSRVSQRINADRNFPPDFSKECSAPEDLHRVEEEFQISSSQQHYSLVEGHSFLPDIHSKEPVTSCSVEKSEKIESCPALKRHLEVCEDDDSSLDDYSIFLMPVKLELGRDSNQALSPLSEIQEISVVYDRNASRREFVTRKPVQSTSTVDEGNPKWEKIKHNVVNPKVSQTLTISLADTASLVSITDPDVSSLGGETCNSNHSHHRATLLHPPPMLSPYTLMREQEMDLLWQEYDETSRRNTSASAQEDPKKGKDPDRDSPILESRKEACNAQAGDNKYDPKKGLPQKDRKTSKGGCWKLKGRRSISKSLLCFSRAWKGFGLAHCLQSPKVKD